MGRDSAGVAIVTASSIDRPLDWEASRIRTLGGKDTEPESFFRVHRGTVAADGRGRIHVWDGSRRRVHAFDSTGAHLWSAGREGAGPGEIAGGNSVTADGSGGAAVFDWRKAALVRFDSLGAVLPEIPIVAMPFRAWEPHAATVGASLAVWQREEFRGQERRQVFLHWIDAGDTLTLLSAAPTLSRTVRLDGCPVTLTVPALNASRVRWHWSDDRVAVNIAPEYVVDVFSDGRKVLSIRRDLDPPTMSEAAALEAYRDRAALGPVAGMCRPDAHEMLERIGYEPRTQLIRQITVARDGSLWVARRSGDGEDDVVVDVFNAGGGYLGTLPDSFPVPLEVLPGDLLLSSERDSLDVERLVLWRVRREAR